VVSNPVTGGCGTTVNMTDATMLIDGWCGVRCLHATNTFCVHLSLHEYCVFDQRREDTVVTILHVVVPKGNHTNIKTPSVYLEGGYLLANREVPEISWGEDLHRASAWIAIYFKRNHDSSLGTSQTERPTVSSL